MSDLQSGNAPSGAAGSSRVQNGGSRPAPGAIGVTTGQTRFRTPTVVMAERRLREQRREQEAAQRRQQEEERRQQSENVVGVGDDRRQPGQPSIVRPPLTEIPPGPAPGTTSVTVSRRRTTDPVPTSNGSNVRIGVPTNPNQPKPGSPRQQQQSQGADAGQISRNRTEALEKLEMPATAEPKAQQPQSTTYPTQPAPAAQPPQRLTFPHAFERWENLSAHWEGLTAYWIHRLEGNRDELSGKPIDQQMARQITDLSAAGANLFHAVVELQRLRASSERKFQRWFLETKDFQEHSKEHIADLERQLLHAREDSSSAALEAAQVEKAKADELVREMRRELQISKEEARRAWEELGRREQEERERTIALRSGEPTLIGGVQVVPMAGMSSRHLGASSRPQTRGGPIPGGPGPTQMSGQQLQQQQPLPPPPPQPSETFSRSQTALELPEREQVQYRYQPGQASPTETDPFTETHWSDQPPQPPLRHEPDTQFYQSPSHSQSQAGSGLAPPRSAASPARGQTQSTSPSRFYQGSGTSTAVYQPLTSTAGPQRPVTAGSDNRSYIPSTASGSGSGEEYHINPDGSYTVDSQGRRIPSNRPISGPGVEEEDIQEHEHQQEEDEDDYTDDVERERMYAQQYSQRQAAVSQLPRPAGTALPSTTAATTYRTPAVPTTTQSYTPPGSRSYSSNVSATSQPMTQPSPGLAPEYENTGYDVHRDDDIPSNIVTGWEGIQAVPRHHHPSRLSAIMEERSGRTTPSRQSYISESVQGGQRAGGNNNNNNNQHSASHSRSFNLE